MGYKKLESSLAQLSELVASWNGEQAAQIEIDLAISYTKKIYEMLRFPLPQDEEQAETEEFCAPPKPKNLVESSLANDAPQEIEHQETTDLTFEDKDQEPLELEAKMEEQVGWLQEDQVQEEEETEVTLQELLKQEEVLDLDEADVDGTEAIINEISKSSKSERRQQILSLYADCDIDESQEAEELDEDKVNEVSLQEQIPLDESQKNDESEKIEENFEEAEDLESKEFDQGENDAVSPEKESQVLETSILETQIIEEQSLDIQSIELESQETESISQKEEEPQIIEKVASDFESPDTEVLESEETDLKEDKAQQCASNQAYILENELTPIETMLTLNDRFLLAHDLFEDDMSALVRALSELNTKQTMDDAMLHIALNYCWNGDSEGAKLLSALLKSRYRA